MISKESLIKRQSVSKFYPPTSVWQEVGALNVSAKFTKYIDAVFKEDATGKVIKAKQLIEYGYDTTTKELSKDGVAYLAVVPKNCVHLHDDLDGECCTLCTTTPEAIQFRVVWSSRSVPRSFKREF